MRSLAPPERGDLLRLERALFFVERLDFLDFGIWSLFRVGPATRAFTGKDGRTPAPHPPCRLPRDAQRMRADDGPSTQRSGPLPPNAVGIAGSGTRPGSEVAVLLAHS